MVVAVEDARERLGLAGIIKPETLDARARQINVASKVDRHASKEHRAVCSTKAVYTIPKAGELHRKRKAHEVLCVLNSKSPIVVRPFAIARTNLPAPIVS